MLDIKIEKPPRTTLWLDTWAIYKLTRAIRGIKVDEKEQEWGNRIVDKIISLVDDKRLIYVKADQEIEIQMGDILVNESEVLQTQLSKGVQANYYKGVEESQIKRVMKATVNNEDSVNLPWQELFISDPIEELDRKQKFLVSVKSTMSIDEKSERLSAKKDIALDWEKLRSESQLSGETFIQRLEKEANGYALAITNAFDSYFAKLISETNTDADYRKLVYVAGLPLSWWEHFSGNPSEKTVENVLAFYKSEDFKKIPAIDVHLQLIAKIISDHEKVKSSDIMDINQISAVLPYAHYMVTDGAMRDRIIYKLKLDRKYGTQIIKIDELENILDSI